jgi:phospholipase/carboxylesterase
MNERAPQPPASAPDETVPDVALADADILDAMQHIPRCLDITNEDFRQIHHIAHHHAVNRLLPGLRAEGLMRPVRAALSPAMIFDEAARTRGTSGFGTLPVVDDTGVVIGMLTCEPSRLLPRDGRHDPRQSAAGQQRRDRPVLRRCLRGHGRAGRAQPGAVRRVGPRADGRLAGCVRRAGVRLGAALAVSSSIALMHATLSLHPPGGATMLPMTPSLLETLEGETGAHPVATVIVMHGLGADGSDFVPVCEALDLSAIGPVRFVFPHAPVRPVTINGGYRMRAWYDILGADLQRREDEGGLRASQAAIAALIDRERERGIPANRIVLAGFSQGCAMTLLTGLRYPERLAGMAGLSGYLPLASTTAAEGHAANRDVPIFLAHGTQDPVVALARGVASRDALRALGHEVEWHDYPMEHAVCPEEIADLNAWLLRVLGSG